MSSGAPLTTSSRAAPSLDQNRHATPLEIERHLVDLVPAGDVERLGGEDRLVERALHAALEAAVEIGEAEARSSLSLAAASDGAPA